MTFHILTEAGGALLTEGGGYLVTEDAVPVVTTGGGFRHIGRFTREELEPEEPAVTVATTEALPVKPPSRKMRKRLAVVAKQAKPRPMNDDDEEEAMILLLAA